MTFIGRLLSISSMAIIIGVSTLTSAEVIISEYVEGSRYNKAIELYNPTDTAIDLFGEGYRLDIFFNGNTTATTSIALTGVIDAQSTYVIADDGADPAILTNTDQTTTSSLFNGDDAVVLFRQSEIIDSLGQIGVDPGSQWGSGDLSTQNNTLRRSFDVTTGDTDPYDGVDLAEWLGLANDTFDGLGTHSDGGHPDLPTEVFIHEIQGTGEVSAMVGTKVRIEGIVTADFQGSGALKGFFVQEEDTDSDADPLTSDGIFIFDGNFGVDVNVGDHVLVVGVVAEYHGLTELTTISEIQILAGAQPLPTAAQIILPLPDPAIEPLYLEAVEGMRVHFTQTLTVSETYNLGRYGELVLSNGRLMNPTNVALPGDPALEVKARNELNRIILDDASTRQNPDPIVYPAPELDADNTVRCGHTVTGVSGVLGYSYGNYRIHPTAPPVFEKEDNPRTPQPEAVGGQIKVASFNVLNYFNGDGQGGGFPTPRGADTATEFTRQRDKIVAAILATRADVIGLMEIENDGYGELSAIADLVNALNARAQQGYHYAMVTPDLPQLGTDQIAVGLIYNTVSVKQVGTAATIATGAFADKNRQPLAQSFTEISSDETFTVVVNHFKSKGSPCDTLGDPDIGDGQGNCNLTRTAAAQQLAQWLTTDPTGVADPDILIIGDLNAYAMEDPITALKNDGYTDLIQSQAGDPAYSYVYKGEAGVLDHALATATMAAQVTGVTAWHINADEPRVLDYNTEYKSAGQINSLYNSDPYRASDHDPVLIGLALTNVFTAQQCSVLGNAPHGWVDVDFFQFYGKQGEKITVEIAAEPAETGNSKRAALGLFSQVPGSFLLKTDSGRLPNQVSAILPAEGYYLIGVVSGPGRSAYRGDYCVSLEASFETSGTLVPFWDIE